MNKETKRRLKKLGDWVKKECLGEKSGHDYGHAKRVTNLALFLAKDYKNIDYEVLTASCLVHDVYGNYKNKKYDMKKILGRIGFSKEIINKIMDVIIQFRHIGKKPKKPFKKTIESEIYEDADNLDALGGIGIIRAVSYGQFKNFPVFKSKKDKLNDSTYGTIKELITWHKSMFTKKAKKIGKERTKIMKLFLKNIENEFR